MNIKALKDKKRQLTSLKVLLIIALGLTLLVTSVVLIVRDSNNKKEDKLLDKTIIETKKM